MAKYIKIHNAPLSGGYVNGSRTDVSIGTNSFSDDKRVNGPAVTTHSATLAVTFYQRLNAGDLSPVLSTRHMTVTPRTAIQQRLKFTALAVNSMTISHS